MSLPQLAFWLMFGAAVVFIVGNLLNQDHVRGFELRPGMALTYDEFRSIE